MKKLLTVVLAFTLCLGLTGCGSNDGKDENKIVVGATSNPHAIILKEAQKEMEKAGFQLEIKEFSDYTQINDALQQGELDANFFQHIVYLDGYNKDKGNKADAKDTLVSAGLIHFEPLGIYADDPKGRTSISLDDLKEGDTITVPDDATNEARALLLLEEYGIIELKEGAGYLATKKDIVKNPKNIVIKELNASRIPASLKDADVAFGVINGNFALEAKVIDKQICAEPVDGEAGLKYSNAIVVRQEDKDNEAVKKLVEILKSDDMKSFIEKEFNGVVVPAK